MLLQDPKFDSPRALQVERCEVSEGLCILKVRSESIFCSLCA